MEYNVGYLVNVFRWYNWIFNLWNIRLFANIIELDVKKTKDIFVILTFNAFDFLMIFYKNKNII